MKFETKVSKLVYITVYKHACRKGLPLKFSSIFSCEKHVPPNSQCFCEPILPYLFKPCISTTSLLLPDKLLTFPVANLSRSFLTSFCRDDFVCVNEQNWLDKSCLKSNAIIIILVLSIIIWHFMKKNLFA